VAGEDEDDDDEDETEEEEDDDAVTPLSASMPRASSASGNKPEDAAASK
jgi:hypothetical protein